ncbi:hypothetical protein [Niabella hirudinis]|uniref:hypothetical protein n=1 Tax=Niabella hirudinis TaxID=1285929 RepID=UPI003EBCC881
MLLLLTVLLCKAVASDSVPVAPVESQREVLPCRLKENGKYLHEKNRIYMLVEKQVHHLRGELQNWHNDPSMKLITQSESIEKGIRPNATFAADLSFLYRFGNYDHKIVGVSRKDLLRNELIPLLRYLVRTHKTGDLKTDDGKAWGDAWQSAHWTAALGNAAWWSWDGLPDDVRSGVRKTVAHEADRIKGMLPPHQLRSDSKSEENGWNSQVLSAALILMPNDRRGAGWEQALQKWAMSSYLRPADSTSKTVVDQVPVYQQFTGANIYDDFTLENHDIVHPDYMGAWILNAGNDLDYLMTDRKPFDAFLYNLPGIYNVQKRLLLPDGGYCYPNGQDWALFRNADWMPVHATAVARFNDPEAVYYLQEAIETAEKMQARNKDGAIYAPGENYFASAQSHLGYWLIQAWLVLHFAKTELAPEKPQQTGVTCFEDGKFMIHRTGTAIHSVSWGAKIMLQLMPVAKDHIVSPDDRNGIGKISVNDVVQTVSLKSIDIKRSDSAFVIKMLIAHGKNIEAMIECESMPDGRLSIKETLKAVKACTTDFIETLSFGILNNPDWVYEKASRLLQIGLQQFQVKAGTGRTYRAEANMAGIDRLRFVLGQSSLITYKTADKLSRSRFTDMLVLNAIPGKHVWKEGAVISKKDLLIVL